MLVPPIFGGDVSPGLRCACWDIALCPVGLEGGRGGWWGVEGVGVVEGGVEGAAGEFAFAQPEEDDGGDDEDVDKAGDHAADDGSGERLHDFGALAAAPHDGHERGDDGADGHDLGTQAQAGAILDGLDKVGAGEGGAELGHSSFEGFL